MNMTEIGRAAPANDDAETVGARIKRLRESRGMTQKQLGAAVGRDTGTISRWERDGMLPKTREATLMANLFGESIDAFTGDDVPSVEPLGAGAFTRHIRMVGTLQAGYWREAVEDDDGDTVPTHLPRALRNMDLQAYTVRGTSMDVLYPEGTIVYATPAIAGAVALRPGQRVIVQRRNRDGLYEASLKEYRVDANGKKWLWPRSDDPQHQAPLAYDGAEEVTITGIVVMAQVNELGR